MIGKVLRPGQLPENGNLVRLNSKVPEIKAQVHQKLDEMRALDESPLDKVSTTGQVAVLDHSFEEKPSGILSRLFRKEVPSFSGTAEFAEDSSPEFLYLKEEGIRSKVFHYEKLPDGSEVYAASTDSKADKLAPTTYFIENPDGTVYIDDTTYGDSFHISLPLLLIEMNSDQSGEWVTSERHDTHTVVRPVEF